MPLPPALGKLLRVLLALLALGLSLRRAPYAGPNLYGLQAQAWVAWSTVGLTLGHMLHYYNNGWVQLNAQRFSPVIARALRKL